MALEINKNIQEITDQELIAQFAMPETKQKAFDFLVNKFKTRLYWHIRRMVVQHDDADDLLQETFIKAWMNLDKFRGESAIYTWLYRIATNNCLTFLENQKKKKSREINVGDDFLANAIKSETNFDNSKIEWQLQLAVNSLPEKQKAVFNLRYYDEMPYAQMSEVMGTSEGALKASYSIAAKKIEEFLLSH
jgi:RNA polymerase sigma factor (sigma-70 family)